MTSSRQFKIRTQKYPYPHAPATKAELLAYVHTAVEALDEHVEDIEYVEQMGLAIQGSINAFRLYDTHPKLQAINDDLLSFEDLESVLQDKDKVNRAFQEFKQYLRGLPKLLEEAL